MSLLHWILGPLKWNGTPKNVKESVVNEEIYWRKYSRKYPLVDQFNKMSFCLWVNGVIFQNFYLCLSQRREILPRKYLFVNFFFRKIQTILHNLYCESFYETRKWNTELICCVLLKLTIRISISTEAVTGGCFVKMVLLQILQKSQENTCARVSFSDKVACWGRNFNKKVTLEQLFSWKFCGIFKTPGECFCK